MNPVRQFLLLLLLPLLPLLLAACGSNTVPPIGAGTPSPQTATPSTSPPRSATPVPDGSQTLTVVASGLGTYMATTIPVALVHNNSTSAIAGQVIATFTISTAAGSIVRTTQTQPETVPPGSTVGFAQRLDLVGKGDRASVTLSSPVWGGTPGPAFFQSAPPLVTCPGCSTDGGLAGVTATLALPAGIAPGTPVDVRVICSGPGGLVGGADETEETPQSGPFTMTLEAIVSAIPGSCTAYGTSIF